MKYKGYVLLTITIIFFSTFEVVASTMKNTMSPLQITFLRFFFGGLVLLPAVIRKKERIRAKDLLFFLELGVINTVVSMGALQLSVNLGKASTAAILFSSNPIFVMLFSAVILKEKVTVNRIICVVLGILGIVLITFKGNVGGDTGISLVLAVVSSLTFGLYTVLGKMKSEGLSSITMISFSAIFGSVFYLPILIFNKIPVFYVPNGAILKMVYLTVFVSGIAYITYMEALKILTASKGAMVYFLKPALASVLAVVFLGESLSFKTLMGMVLVLIGMYINFSNISFGANNKQGMSA